jgi:glycosyltransferase involved in cell wall biosynthesis
MWQRDTFARFLYLLWSAGRPVANVIYRISRVNVDAIWYLNQFGARALGLAKQIAPDAVHAHDLITVSCGYALSSTLRIPLVYDAHELETHTNYWSLSRAIWDLIARYEAVFARRSGAIVTVSESIADWLRDNYKIARPVVVHNSPDLGAAQTTVDFDTLRRRLDLEPTVPLITYIGSVTIDRGLPICTEALALLPGYHFALVGPRYLPVEENIREIARKLGIENRVHLIDPVPSDRVSPFVSDADCCIIVAPNVCLSYYFSFPNKLLQGVMGGLPVVVSRLIEMANFTQRFGIGVVVDETDVHAIAEGFKAVVEDKGKYIPSEETRSQIIREYGWDSQKKRLVALYGSLVGSPLGDESSTTA